MTITDVRRSGGLSTLARAALWGGIAALLSLPAIAMRFTPEVNWTASDFVVMGTLLGSAGLAVEFLARRGGDLRYRLAAGLAILGAFLLVWIDLAVGIIGRGDEPANLMFAGVIAVGVVMAAAARFRPAGMARAMLGAVGTLAVATIAAFVIARGSEGPTWPLAMLGTTGVLSALWLGAAALFARSARAE